MKIKNRKKVIAFCAAFVAAGVGMNVQNAIAGYGMNQDVVSLVASGSSNSSSNGSSNVDLDVTSVNSNGNAFHYIDRSGNPQYCTLYIYKKAGVVYAKTTEPQDKYEANGEYEKIVVRGIEDCCPKKGKGCNPFSCQEIPYKQ